MIAKRPHPSSVSSLRDDPPSPTTGEGEASQWPRAAIFALALLLALPAAACAQQPEPAQWREIASTATPAPLGAESAGALRFLGGIAIDSPDQDFGGLSDFAIQPSGDFVSVSDAGFLVRGRLTLNEAGAPSGVAALEIAPMRDENGALYPSKEDADAEGLALQPDGMLAVSFEQTQTIRFFNLNDPSAPSTAGPALETASSLPSNGGLEALAPMSDGRLLVGAEDTGELWIATPGATAPAPRIAQINLPLGYGLVELDPLPNGDFIALLRFYAPVIGTRIKVWRLDGAGLAQSRAVVTELAHLQGPLALDNFEGVSVVPTETGARLYIVSDDNYNTRQRTLIYAFELPN